MRMIPHLHTHALRLACLVTLGCSLSLTACSVVGSVSYKPPFVPIEFVIDTQGHISIQADASITTPIGDFGVGASAEQNVQPPSNGLLMFVQRLVGGKPMDAGFQVNENATVKTVVIDNDITLQFAGNLISVDARGHHTILLTSPSAATSQPTSTRQSHQPQPTSTPVHSRPTPVPQPTLIPIFGGLRDGGDYNACTQPGVFPNLTLLYTADPGAPTQVRFTVSVEYLVYITTASTSQQSAAAYSVSPASGTLDSGQTTIIDVSGPPPSDPNHAFLYLNVKISAGSRYEVLDDPNAGLTPC